MKARQAGITVLSGPRGHNIVLVVLPSSLEFLDLFTRPQSLAISPFPAEPSSSAGINIRTFTLQAPGLLGPKPMEPASGHRLGG